MPYWRISLLTPVNFKLSVAVSEVFGGKVIGLDSRRGCGFVCCCFEK
jgi:hypothetical protein